VNGTAQWPPLLLGATFQEIPTHAFLKRRLRSLLQDVASKTDSASREKQAKEAAKLETFLRPPQSPKKDLRLAGLSPKERKEKAAVLYRLDMAVIRQHVLERAAGRCEACGSRFYAFNMPQIDHWLGGSGRRRPQQSVKTCWALCVACDKARTHNRPSAEHWNALFKKHCQKYGYPFHPHIVHQRLPRERPRRWPSSASSVHKNDGPSDSASPRSRASAPGSGSAD